MRFYFLGKVAALLAVLVVLLWGLQAISEIVREREGRQREAETSVADALAGAQTVLGPVLQRQCRETWEQFEGEGKERRLVRQHRDFSLAAWPRTLDVTASAGIEPRYRGLFKINSYLAKAHITADWTDLAQLKPVAEYSNGMVRCEAATLGIAVTDARGIQAASVRIGTQSLPVLPGSLINAGPRGFHSVLKDDLNYDAPLRLDIAFNLAGTRSLAWVPVGDETRVQLDADWPHPSFGGRFLPTSRTITERDFKAQWQVSSLATTAPQMVLAGTKQCALTTLAMQNDRTDPTCVDSFGVGFIDPVSTYVLSDRAVKYGLLFVVLTLVGVALVEVMRRLRVHPMQYLLVGSALTLFFLLLLSLSEHVAFAWAYLGASVACTALLTFYAHHILHGWRPGLAFGGGVALLYAALYALLQMEQTALVLGSLLLFVVLAAVMVATRRLDWYALTAQLRADSTRRPAVDGLGA